MSFESHKAVGDWQALFGINFRCHHLSWYTMEGEAKRDFPASILHQSAWWREYKYVEDYFARIGVVMNQGKPCCDVLVINTVESVWCQVYPGWSRMLTATSREVTDLEMKYREIFHWLTGSHIDFDYGDEEMMSRLFKIESQCNNSPVLRIGEAVYKIVIVAGLCTIRSSTLRILDEFIKAGGKVIFVGEVPSYVDALMSQKASVTTKNAVCVPFCKENIVNACLNYLDNVIQVLDADTGKSSENIFIRVMEDGGYRYAFAINTDRECSSGQIKIRIYTNGFAEEWLCFNGERYYIGEAQENGILEINTSFVPAGEHLFVIMPKRDFKVLPMPTWKESARYELKGLYPYELDEPNVCVLDTISYSLDAGEYQEEMEILKADRGIRMKLGLCNRDGEMLQPWFTRKVASTVSVPLKLMFRFYIVDLPQEDVFLAVENPSSFQIRVNGNTVDTAETFGWWIAGAL